MTIVDAQKELGITTAAIRELEYAPSYEVGLERFEALKEQARRRYRELARVHHPDRNGGSRESNERMAALNVAMKMIEESRYARPRRRAPLIDLMNTAGVGAVHVTITAAVFVDGLRVF